MHDVLYSQGSQCNKDLGGYSADDAERHAAEELALDVLQCAMERHVVPLKLQGTIAIARALAIVPHIS